MKKQLRTTVLIWWRMDSSLSRKTPRSRTTLTGFITSAPMYKFKSRSAIFFRLAFWPEPNQFCFCRIQLKSSRLAPFLSCFVATLKFHYGAGNSSASRERSILNHGDCYIFPSVHGCWWAIYDLLSIAGVRRLELSIAVSATFLSYTL